MRIGNFLVTVCLGLAAGPAASHEFWVAPERYQVAAGEEIRAELRVGQEFVGPSLFYNPGGFVRFDLVREDGSTPVPGRLGDTPALVAPAGEDGLVIVVHETTDLEVNYKDWELFRHFVEDKDLGPALETHAERGLPQTGFRESYRRFAKSLVAVGDGAGADQRVGLTFEIVAEANPYTESPEARLPLRVYLDGQPRADAQLELFERAPDGTVTQSLHRTDLEGRIAVPVTPGSDYLANSVVLRRLDNDLPEAGPVWHSDWASLTFRVPEARP